MLKWHVDNNIACIDNNWQFRYVRYDKYSENEVGAEVPSKAPFDQISIRLV